MPTHSHTKGTINLYGVDTTLNTQSIVDSNAMLRRTDIYTTTTGNVPFKTNSIQGTTANNGTSSAHNNTQPTLVQNKIIKL